MGGEVERLIFLELARRLLSDSTDESLSHPDQLAMGEVVQAIRVIIFFLPVRSAPNQFFTQSTHSERLTSFPQLRMCIVSLVSPLLGRSQLLR